MTTRTEASRELDAELAGLRRTHHGLVIAERRNLSQIAQILARLRKLNPPAHPRLGSAFIPDVSEFQPGVSWPAVHNGGTWRAIVKATQYRTDYQFARNWRGMELSGFVARGAYHYFTEEPGITQARRLLAAVEQAGGLKHPFEWDPIHGPVGDFLAVDFEQAYTGVLATRAELQDLVGELHRQVGYRVLLYTGGPFWNAATGDWQNDLGTILWHSAYVANELSYMPACWHRALSHLWQYTDGRYGRQPHTVPGLAGGDVSITVPAS
jgi:hypothetical protein